jgi:nucleoside-diphosphate kinase
MGDKLGSRAKMNKERTMVMIKPDGVRKEITNECIRRIENAGLKINLKKKILLNSELAGKFRKEIKENHPVIFESLIDYMTEGPCVAMIIEGENAITKLRDICGPTNPKEAPRGTIRGDFAEGDMRILYNQGNAVRNIIHSSENSLEAQKEIKLIFGEIK